MSKTTNKSGFTIIEVVITIAIGAAVMALVLNAVAGARRSQRNNARTADVNQVAAGINQYIATRNSLPVEWGDISGIIDPSKFGHYDKVATNSNASVNAQGAWTAGTPAAPGGFDSASAGAATRHVCTTSSDNSSCTPSVPSGITPCTFVTPATDCSHQIPTNGQPSSSGLMGDGGADDADYVVVFREANCAGTSTVGVGGIREMAIAYKLEGQDDIICLEV